MKKYYPIISKWSDNYQGYEHTSFACTTLDKAVFWIRFYSTSDEDEVRLDELQRDGSFLTVFKANIGVFNAMLPCFICKFNSEFNKKGKK